jgi:FkbM family methyltransferase
VKHVQSNPPESREETQGRLQQIYASYRQWRRSRGRQKKAERRLKRAVRFYGQFIEPGMLCFDVGANLGNRTEAFLRLGARVIAVEPQESCAQTLMETFGGDPSFTLIRQALDKSCGSKEMLMSTWHTVSSMSHQWIESVQTRNLFPGCQWDNKVVVETTTLDTLIERYGSPDFLKIDVEGFEYDVLQGLSMPVAAVSFEYTLGILEPTINSIHHLAGLGRVQFNYSEGESLRLAMKQWVPGDRMTDILLTSQGLLCGDVYARFERADQEGAKR